MSDIEQLTALVSTLTDKVEALSAEVAALRAAPPVPEAPDFPAGLTPDTVAYLQFAQSAARYNEAMSAGSIREQNQFILQQQQGWKEIFGQFAPGPNNPSS